MKKLRLAYFGTPDFSAEFLEKMYTDTDLPIEIVLVVTQEDKVVGRNSEPTPNAVKSFAKAHNIDVAHSLSGFDCSYREIDIAFLFAYGKIIKTDLLRAPKHGFWNLHPSMLPNFRGASPVSYPLILGKDQTGVSLMIMEMCIRDRVQIHQVQIERGGQLQRRVGATGRGRRQAGLHGDGEGFGAGRLPVDYLCLLYTSRCV